MSEFRDNSGGDGMKRAGLQALERKGKKLEEEERWKAVWGHARQLEFVYIQVFPGLQYCHGIAVWALSTAAGLTSCV